MSGARFGLSHPVGSRATGQGYSGSSVASSSVATRLQKSIHSVNVVADSGDDAIPGVPIRPSGVALDEDGNLLITDALLNFQKLNALQRTSQVLEQDRRYGGDNRKEHPRS